MRTKQRLIVPMVVVTLVGLVSAAGADGWGRSRKPTRGPDPYRHDTQFRDGYTYNDYWGGNVIDAGRGWVTIPCRGVPVRIRITNGHPGFRRGERVRVVPFRQAGREAVAELRLANRGFEPVAEGRYSSAKVTVKRTNDGWYVPAHSGENRRDAGYAVDHRGNAYRTQHFYNEGYGRREPAHRNQPSRSQRGSDGRGNGRGHGQGRGGRR